MPTPLTTPIPDDAEYRQLAAIASELLGPDARIGNSWNGTQFAFLSQRDVWEVRGEEGITHTEFTRRLNAAFPHLWNPSAPKHRRRPKRQMGPLTRQQSILREHEPSPAIDDAIRVAFSGSSYGAGQRAVVATGWSRAAINRRACQLGLVSRQGDYVWSEERGKAVRMRSERVSKVDSRRDRVLAVVAESNSRSEAAAKLAVNYSTLIRWLQKWGIAKRYRKRIQSR